MKIVNRIVGCAAVGLFLLAGCASTPDAPDGPSSEGGAEAAQEAQQGADSVELAGRSVGPDEAFEEGAAPPDDDATEGSQQVLECTSGYFQPNNGSPGGGIEAWRLCYEGGSNYRICRGGYAPIRPYNSLCGNGTVHYWYPQGWSGWVQSWEG